MLIDIRFMTKPIFVIVLLWSGLIETKEQVRGTFIRKNPLFTKDLKFNGLSVQSLVSFSQIMETIVSLDHSYIVFSVTEWDSVTKAKSSYFRYANIINPSKSYVLTNKVEKQVDKLPHFSKKFPNHLIFSRTMKGSTNVWYVEFPPRKLNQERQLTNYAMPISLSAFKGDLLVFTIEGDVACKGNIECIKKAKEAIASRGKNSYVTYDSLMVRHWSKWSTPGHCTHPFYQVITIEGNELVLKGAPYDMLQGEYINAPPLDNSGRELSISSDGKHVAFAFLRNDQNQAWNTRWEISLFNRETNVRDVITTNAFYPLKGRNRNPQFNPSGDVLHFLSMEREGLECDHFILYTYDLITKTLKDYPIFTAFQPDIEDYKIYSQDNIDFIILVVTDKGYKRLYKFDYEKFTLITTDDTIAFTKPVAMGNNQYIVRLSSFMRPHYIALMTYEFNEDHPAVIKSLIDLNKEDMKKYVLSEPEYFTYDSEIGKKDLQGWLFKPLNFEEEKKYPMVLLIHGGPEGVWTVKWNTVWNPQIWAQNGYVTVMINPHGSMGMGRDFKDAVRNDWGGLPYRDLMRGVDYLLLQYPFIDGNRLGACGASYGGYMVNWIQGNNDRFKALVTHSGVFSSISMFYSTEELWFPMTENCPVDSVGCTPFDNKQRRDQYEKYNPERTISNWKTPHLVLHGSLDYRVPIEEGISLFTALQLKKIPSKFVHFPNEHHWITNNDNIIQWYKEVIGWLDKFLK